MSRVIVFLIDALIAFLLIRMFVRLLSGSRSVQRPPAGARPREVAGGTLVRDPQCGTYVPESRALRVQSGQQTLYFCSTACRDAYHQRA